MPRFDVKKDPLDLRDVYYEPSLAELPFMIDNRKKVPKILNQGTEGACTGFGLAAVANYLLHHHSAGRQNRPFVSPRMLYEMAKRYDEWEGEHYDGSSIRGAMKGWNKHGVCSEDSWPYDPKRAGELTVERQRAALGIRLGAYFRVRHLHLNHVHSALNEAGIVYASANVHEGWDEVDRTGRIPFRRKSLGGHAFAIVGYDEDGFWIQNSWTKRWGNGGFGHISYEDWIENGYDCWVARLGVPTGSLALEEGVVAERLTKYDHIPREAAVLSDIRLHFVNLGNDGRFSQSGLYSSSKETVEEIVEKGLREQFGRWGGPRRLLLYAHGGLSNEKGAALGINRMRLPFLANQIYPLYFMWETGIVDSVKGIVEDAFRRRPFTGWQDDMKGRFQDLMDEAIELSSRGLGLPVWSQMKDNAQRASLAEPDEGGAAYVARRLAQFASDEGRLELHLVGHSAGAIFHSYLIPRLLDAGLQVKTLTLLAPASTTELFRSNVLDGRRLRRGVESVAIFNLNDDYERADSVTPVYNKSILYLVSEAFEKKHHAPLLGMEQWVRKDRGLTGSLGAPTPAGKSTLVYSVGLPRLRLKSGSTTHAGFDDDADTLNSTLRIARGSNTLSRTF